MSSSYSHGFTRHSQAIFEAFEIFNILWPQRKSGKLSLAFWLVRVQYVLIVWKPIVWKKSIAWNIFQFTKWYIYYIKHLLTYYGNNYCVTGLFPYYEYLGL